MEKDRIYQGDALSILKTWPDNIIDCCVTSPPYWALRDYNVDGQIGQEKDFNRYIDNLVRIFSQVKRVLKKEGTLFVVISDTFNGSGGAGGDYNRGGLREGQPKYRQNSSKTIGQKSLLLIPERFAIKMIEDGWILRNKIVWHKPNCMPQSAKDRFTVDFEYIYFFSKEKKYYFNTLYEPFLTNDISGQRKFGGNKFQGYGRRTYSGKIWVADKKGRLKRCVWSVSTQPLKEAHYAPFPEKLIEPILEAGCPVNGLVLDPFIGSGTTALVSLRQNKHYIGIDLNPEYVRMAQKRINSTLMPYIS